MSSFKYWTENWGISGIFCGFLLGVIMTLLVPAFTNVGISWDIIAIVSSLLVASIFLIFRTTKHFIENETIIFGVIFTFIMLIVGSSVFLHKKVYKATGNEIGDFLAGFIGSLALIWAVLTVYIQSRELALQRAELTDIKQANVDQAIGLNRSSTVQAQIYLDKRIEIIQRQVRERYKQLHKVIHIVKQELNPALIENALHKPFIYWFDILMDCWATQFDEAKINKNATIRAEVLIAGLVFKDSFTRVECLYLSDLNSIMQDMLKLLNTTENLMAELSLSEDNNYLENLLGLDGYGQQFQNFEEIATFTKLYYERLIDVLNERSKTKKLDDELLKFLVFQNAWNETETQNGNGLETV